ncbi:MAG: MBL fold metallo-hydrolase, partial [Methanolinea sp.]
VAHVAAVMPLARAPRIPVYATGGTPIDLLAAGGRRRDPVRAVKVDYGEVFSVGDFSISAFPVSHDAREPCGFLIREGDVVLACCTDTGTVTDRMREILSAADGLVLESNHCPRMLRDGPYPESLKRRIRSKRGHLSNNDAAACINGLCAHLHSVMLAHLSEVNNTPEKALACAREGAGLFSHGLEITVATNVGSPAGWPRGIRL